LARKILLADDSVTAQNMGRKILTDAGYEVITVNNGSAALKRVAEQKPDLIVLDVYMPGYSGLEVCQRLKDAQDTARIPILLTVGKLEPFKPEEARKVRADSYIVKPFEASELLSALTRLEDRMVPQSDGPRFTANVYGVERFDGDASMERKQTGSDDSETGWKNRIRFPSKKKKQEPEPDPEPETDYGMNPFRDFRRGRGKPQAASASPAKIPAAQPGPTVVPDIPRDITPDELDALSALAAKLDGPNHEAETVAAAAEKTVGAESAAADATPKAATEDLAAGEAKTSPEAPAPLALAMQEPETAALPEMPVDAPPAVAADTETIPVSQAIAPTDASVEEASQPTAAVLAEAEPTPPEAFIAAPVDREDEPMFSLASRANPESTSEVQTQAEAVSEPGAVTESVQADSNSPAAVDVSRAEEAPPSPEPTKVEAESVNAEQPATDPTPTVDAPAIAAVAATDAPALQESAPIVPASPDQGASEPASHEPTEEELAAALRLLTPAEGHSESSSMPSQEVLVAAGALLAEEAARRAGAGSRWVAEAVALSPEEAAVSLEEEMFRKFSLMSIATDPALEDTATTVAPTIAASAVPETISAAPGLDAGAEAKVDARVEANAEEIPAAAPVSEIAPSAAIQQEVTPEPQEPALEAAASEESAAAPAASDAVQERGAEAEEPKDESASATFAEAAQSTGVETAMTGEPAAIAANEAPAPAELRSPAPSETTSPAHEQSQASPSDAETGSEEPMAKNAKDNGKSAKSGWHQIRTAPASAPAQADPVESAKQNDSNREEPQKAMAAAAAGDDASAATTHSPTGSATDAGAIANIVDSVLADLRPKIVEEIAKKLAGK